MRFQCKKLIPGPKVLYSGGDRGTKRLRLIILWDSYYNPQKQYSCLCSWSLTSTPEGSLWNVLPLPPAFSQDVHFSTSFAFVFLFVLRYLHFISCIIFNRSLFLGLNVNLYYVGSSWLLVWGLFLFMYFKPFSTFDELIL